MMSSSLSSDVGILKVGDVHNKYGYVTLRVELIPKISIVHWETDLVRIPEQFRPYVSTYTLNCAFYIYKDTGIIITILNPVKEL